MESYQCLLYLHTSWATYFIVFLLALGFITSGTSLWVTRSEWMLVCLLWVIFRFPNDFFWGVLCFDLLHFKYKIYSLLLVLSLFFEDSIFVYFILFLWRFSTVCFLSLFYKVLIVEHTLVLLMTDSDLVGILRAGEYISSSGSEYVSDDVRSNFGFKNGVFSCWSANSSIFRYTVFLWAITIESFWKFHSDKFSFEVDRSLDLWSFKCKDEVDFEFDLLCSIWLS